MKIRKYWESIYKETERENNLCFQENYIEKDLEKFRMSDAKTVVTPLTPHFKLSVVQFPKDQYEIEEIAKVPYASAICCIM